MRMYVAHLSSCSHRRQKEGSSSGPATRHGTYLLYLLLNTKVQSNVTEDSITSKTRSRQEKCLRIQNTVPVDVSTQTTYSTSRREESCSVAKDNVSNTNILPTKQTYTLSWAMVKHRSRCIQNMQPLRTCWLVSTWAVSGRQSRIYDAVLIDSGMK